MIRHMLLGAASAAALAMFVPAAQAADLPAYEAAPAVAAPVPSFTWTGPYVGAQASYGWGRASNTKVDGWSVGGFVGYNVQLDNSPVVFGVETDLNYTEADGNRRSAGRRTSLSGDYNGAVRGRVGYAFDRFLVYGAGGLAYADREFRRFGDKDSKTAVGWTAGGGVEAAVSDNVTVRGEYRYNDYGKDKFNAGGSGRSSSYTEHRATIGVAYKFTSPW